MPVISQIQTLRRRRWLQLWPLLLLAAVLLLGGLWLMQHWPSLLWQGTQWQRSLNGQIAALMQQVRAEPQRAGLVLVLFSLLYGILHAAGPGHGKLVITTYLATHPSRLKSSLRLTFAASLLQGSVAVALVTLLLGVFDLSSRQLHQSSFWLERGSYLLVMGLGVLLMGRAFRALRQHWHSLRQPFRALRPLKGEPHVHSEHCGCGHRHMPTDEALAAAGDWRTRVALVLSMGLRPCSGAIMMLLFAKVIGAYLWGVVAAFVMAFGTSLTISLLALGVHSLQRLLMRNLRSGPVPAWRRIGRASLTLAGGLLLLATGLFLWFSAQPGLTGSGNPLLR
ncbi:nickel/cobalt transporter [Nissabacter archeti]|uniref:Nickel/cobalt efflux system n=1 Tax=Nissabacter archeti TaxID=1917880 RepID=A0ABS5JHE0_9GAMM|nr:nickel/cobalt transporter [Nissabacter archeti]MBS0969355.1 nickel/cobalt transporter [Nissabacter archeti]